MSAPTVSSISNAPMPPYQGGAAVQKLAIINLNELEAEAKRSLPPAGFGYI